MTESWKQNRDTAGNPIWTWDVNGKTYDDPIQGNQKSCALLAAVSSIAWTKALWLNARTPCTESANTYEVKFYQPRNVAIPPLTVYIDDCLPWDNTTSFSWARSSDPSVSNPTELWPCVYEKAFASYSFYTQDTINNSTQYLNLNFYPGTCASPICQPDWLNKVQNFIPWGGNPITTMGILANKEPFEYLTDRDPSGNVIEPMTIFNSIAGVCTRCYSGNNYEHWRTKNSTTYGYYALAAMTTTTVSPFRDDHSYSIFGVIKDKAATTDPTKNYIVVRDPVAQNLPAYPGTPVDYYCPSSTNSMKCNGTSGIIAVPVSDFKTSFFKYGWIKG